MLLGDSPPCAHMKTVLCFGDSNTWGYDPVATASAPFPIRHPHDVRWTGILARELGTTQTVDFGTVTNPALEPNDVARVTRLRAGIDEDHIIDALTIGLDAAAAMTGRTRAIVA